MHSPRYVRWVTWHPLRGSALLGLRVVETTTRVNLWRAASARTYPFVIGVVGLILTVSMVPFASILISAILLRRDRWQEIVFLSSLGSATGGVVLYLIFHHLAWEQITAAYPDLMQSKAWSDATRWVSAYGSWALLGIAATPFPQTPALIFTDDISVGGVTYAKRFHDIKSKVHVQNRAHCQLALRFSVNDVPDNEYGQACDEFPQSFVRFRQLLDFS
jgi:membrane protein YqaA with SNARE-associated domain